MSAHLIDAGPERPAALDDRDFALVVGDLSPRKNLALLMRLWETTMPGDLTLVVVGPDHGTDTPVRRDLLQLEAAMRVDRRTVWDLRCVDVVCSCAGCAGKYSGRHA